MYKPVQKKSSSWTPASSQSKSKSLTKPGTFSVQPKSERKSSQQQEIPSYSPQAADALAANVMRSLETPQQEHEEAKSVQRQLNLGAAFVADGVTPIAPSIPSIQSKEVGIQRQCSACAKEQQEQSAQEGKDVDEMSLGVGVQTKLTVGAPGDKYEQEADQVAAQVMSMSVTPDSSPQVQRFGEDDTPVQRWSLAQSITPVVQRQVDEQVQMRSLVQRAFQAGGNQASGDLESRLNASKGGGNALAPEIRAFMEPRFGADFSQVRVHTGSEAVQMNRELGAQAFAHGSDVYFGAGKSPGNNELTAHELTHVVQQGAAPDIQHQSVNENGERHVQSNELYMRMVHHMVQRWPGDGMLPPGDCNWATYIGLRGSVLTAKAIMSTLGGGCRHGDSCLFLATKIAAITAEIAARVALDATCFKGGDTGHRQQVQDKINMLNRCYRFFSDSGCPPELVAAMAVVVESARAAVAAATAAVAVAAVVALIAAIIALAEVIAALVAAAAAATAEAAAVAAAAAAVIALLVLIKDELSPEDSSSA